jgi:formamidase
VRGAEPGDLLVVDIADLGPVPQQRGTVAGQGWGYTGIFAREKALIDTAPQRVPPLALPPNATNALLGSLDGEAVSTAAGEAARTVPPREHGGNQNIKNFSRGARGFYPVYVPGANLSVGDLHLSQGDGEITFCGGIEMGGFVDLHVDLIKNGMATYGIEAPVFLPGRTEPHYSEYLTFTGISVSEDGEQHYLDTRLAYRRACLHAIDYLTTFGHIPEQVYLLLGGAPVDARYSGVVDIPNACATLYIPTEIFDFDVRPGTTPPRRVDRGQCAVSTPRG